MLIKRQTPTLQITPAARTHPTFGTQPPGAHHAIGTRLRRRVSDELTPRHRRPELLHDLSDHPLRELRHHTPPITHLPERNLTGTRLQGRQRAATQPPDTDDLESPSNQAGVAITARTQGQSNEHALAIDQVLAG
jgi:hypothetical protein